MSLKTTLEALGNQVRRLSGKTNKMTLDAMTQALSGVNVGSNVSGADAVITDVLSGKKFVGANGVLETGSMINRGAVSQTLDTSTKSYTIPAGYHNGGGKVQIETQTKSVTPSASAQTVYPDAGKVLSSVTVAASSGRVVKTGNAYFSYGASGAIQTNIPVSANNEFYMFSDGNRDENGIVSVLYSSGVGTKVYASTNVNDEDEMYVSLNASKVSVTFSGTLVTVENSYSELEGSYKWILIQ
jgi:hypothetical protein